jgi:hypothetical protein
MDRVSLTIPCFALLTVGLLNPPGISFRTPDQPSVQIDEQLRIFSGTIVPAGDVLFLQADDEHKTRYGLDDQSLARKFINKKVAVTGALDKTATIHVKNIEEQKATWATKSERSGSGCSCVNSILRRKLDWLPGLDSN